MYGPERIRPLLDVKADRVDDRKRIGDGRGDRFLVMNVSPRYFQSAVGVLDNRAARLGMTCGYSRREIPTQQVANDAAPEETGSTKDRDRSPFSQRMHQRSLTNTNTSLSFDLGGRERRNTIGQVTRFQWDLQQVRLACGSGPQIGAPWWAASCPIGDVGLPDMRSDHAGALDCLSHLFASLGGSI
jgi:hypothetical protein